MACVHGQHNRSGEQTRTRACDQNCDDVHLLETRSCLLSFIPGEDGDCSIGKKL